MLICVIVCVPPNETLLSLISPMLTPPGRPGDCAPGWACAASPAFPPPSSAASAANCGVLRPLRLRRGQQIAQPVIAPRPQHEIVGDRVELPRPGDGLQVLLQADAHKLGQFGAIKGGEQGILDTFDLFAGQFGHP